MVSFTAISFFAKASTRVVLSSGKVIVFFEVSQRNAKLILGSSAKSSRDQDLWKKPPQELCPPTLSRLASVQISTVGDNSLIGALALAANPKGKTHQGRHVGDPCNAGDPSRVLEQY